MPKWIYTDPHLNGVLADHVGIIDGCLRFTTTTTVENPHGLFRETKTVLMVAAGHWVECFEDDGED